jgi:hypothetical protein
MEKYELYHHGVKGMKWGVRRKPKKNSSPASAIKSANKRNSQQAKPQNRKKTPSRKNTEKEDIDRMINALDRHMKAQKTSLTNTVAITALKAAGFDYASTFMQGAGNAYVRNLSISSGYDFWR